MIMATQKVITFYAWLFRLQVRNPCIFPRGQTRCQVSAQVGRLNDYPCSRVCFAFVPGILLSKTSPNTLGQRLAQQTDRQTQRERERERDWKERQVFWKECFPNGGNQLIGTDVPGMRWFGTPSLSTPF